MGRKGLIKALGLGVLEGINIGGAIFWEPNQFPLERKFGLPGFIIVNLYYWLERERVVLGHLNLGGKFLKILGGVWNFPY